MEKKPEVEADWEKKVTNWERQKERHKFYRGWCVRGWSKLFREKSMETPGKGKRRNEGNIKFISFFRFACGSFQVCQPAPMPTTIFARTEDTWTHAWNNCLLSCRRMERQEFQIRRSKLMLSAGEPERSCVRVCVCVSLFALFIYYLIKF